MRENPVKEKSYSFALKIIHLAGTVREKAKDHVLSRQVLRSGTSIGANVEEAGAAQTKRDFTAKMAIASKEARETHYWLRLLLDSKMITVDTAKSMIGECEELIRLLTAIVRSSQKN